MIGSLKGTIEAIFDDRIILDVGGVGYIIAMSSRLLSRIPARGQSLSLLIETLIGEDFIRLYGFASTEEQEWFKLLLSVQGVGSKAALAILNVLSPDELVRTVMLQDSASFSKAQGVGPKLASRLVVELKGKKLPSGNGYTGTSVSIPAQTEITETSKKKTTAKKAQPAISISPEEESARQATKDALSALVNLGYALPDAYKAIAAAEEELSLSERNLNNLIRLGLKELTL